jgi:hypothetical protein
MTTIGKSGAYAHPAAVAVHLRQWASLPHHHLEKREFFT